MKPEADWDPDEARIIDGDGAVLGRLASTAASLTLDGERVVVVNAEDVVVSGNRSDVVEKYRRKTEFRSDRGPKQPKRPDGLLRRTVRGMVPYKKQRGRDAMDNLRVYVGVPEEYGDVELEEAESSVDDIGRGDYVRLGEISEKIGANVTW